MDISIIIPCFNLELYIERCLKSIIAQRYDSDLFEIIVILDSCTDNSEKIVKEILKGRKQDKAIKVNCHRPGLARNFGIEVATGKYVWFIDGDDYLTDVNAFLKILQVLHRNDSSIVFLKDFTSEKPVSENWAAWRFFYKKSLIGDTRFSDLPIDEDIEFFQNIIKKKEYRITKINGILYHHTFPRRGSIVTEHNKQIWGINH